MIDAEMPNYLNYPQPEPEEKTRQLDRLNELAIRDGWLNAAKQTYGSVEYITDPVRYKFLDLLPLDKESTILEIGAQHGQITSALAPRVGFVHALEVVPQFAKFAAERCRQEGLDNVKVACGVDDCRLPFEDGLFNGVILNLVLEWCGSRHPSNLHVDSQKRLLSECARVLKPGGWIYLTTKNRYGMVLLQGVHDVHTYNWRFGQAMPRWLIAVLAKITGKPRTEGMLHSYSGLHKIISEAGFTNLKPFWAVPDTEYRNPSEIIPADAESIRAARKRPDFKHASYTKSEVMFKLTPAPLVKHLTSSLTFLAEKAV